MAYINYTQEEMDEMEMDDCTCPFPHYVMGEHKENCVRVHKARRAGWGSLPTSEPHTDFAKLMFANLVYVYELPSGKLVWRYNAPQ